MPLRARTQSYPVVIRNGQVLIWHDVEGSEPDMDILPPELPGLDTGEYTDWFWEVVPIENSHCRELIDNVVDMAHFYYVHFSFPTSFRNVFEGTQATQYMQSKGRPDVSGGYGDAELFLKSEATYYGPAYMINWLDVDYKGFETEVILINCHLPTGPDSFTLQYGITVKKPEGLDDKTANYIAKKYAQMFGEGFLQDVHIWKNKVPVQNPLLCEEDGPVYQLRRWYEQFYVDVDDIAPEMTDRFEFEVDTTQANEFWQRGGRREPREEGRRGLDVGRDSPRPRPPAKPPDAVVRADQRRDAGGPASLHQRPAGRGRLPRLPGEGRCEEEQRAPHVGPVDDTGAHRLPGVREDVHRARRAGAAHGVSAAGGEHRGRRTRRTGPDRSRRWILSPSS